MVTDRLVNQTLLIALEGTEYLCSRVIHGPQGATRTHANGPVTYSPTALTPVSVKPGLDPAIPQAPELVCPQEGAATQDGELYAVKRGLATGGSDDRALGVTLWGDEVYAQVPFCPATRDQSVVLTFVLPCRAEGRLIGLTVFHLSNKNG